METVIVGNIEHASLPDFGFFDIDAKIDTGADSCSIHCNEIRIDQENGTVHFKLFQCSFLFLLLLLFFPL